MASRAVKAKMPTSAPGNSVGRVARVGRLLRRHAARGFTLIELLIVIAIIALSVGLVAMSLPDGDVARLEEEGARLTALLEMARAEARVSGTAVRWVPADLETAAADDGKAQRPNFRFIGTAAALDLPTRWLDPRITVQVIGASGLVLGPEAILPPQRLVLSLGERRLELVTDGLGPFAPVDPNAPATPAGAGTP